MLYEVITYVDALHEKFPTTANTFHRAANQAQSMPPGRHQDAPEARLDAPNPDPFRNNFV